jgi:hypothetical protein
MDKFGNVIEIMKLKLKLGSRFLNSLRIKTQLLTRLQRVIVVDSALCLLQFGMIICTDISEWRGLSKSLARLQWIWLCCVARITLHLRSFSGGASSLGGLLIQMRLRFLMYLCWKV